MKNYNEKIAELNKEIENVNKLGDDWQEETSSDLEYRTNETTKINAKIEQLNELRAEAIEEVKKLQKRLSNRRIETDNQRDLAVIDYLKVKWNITDAELQAIAFIEQGKKLGIKPDYSSDEETDLGSHKTEDEK